MATEQAKRGTQHISGISNCTYDLLAMLTRKLEGIAALEEFKQDAQDQGDSEAQRLFNELQQRAVEEVAKLRELVRTRLG